VAPHRVLECVQDLKARYGAERELFIGRELTKKFENLATDLAAAKENEVMED